MQNVGVYKVKEPNKIIVSMWSAEGAVDDESVQLHLSYRGSPFVEFANGDTFSLSWEDIIALALRARRENEKGNTEG